MNNKAQSALEFLMIVGIATLLLFPVMILFFNFTQQSTDKIIDSQVAEVGNTLITKAESMYNYGRYAKEVVELTFPKGIDDMLIYYTNSDYVLQFNITSYRGEYDKVFLTHVNITGSFNETDYLQGMKKISIECIEDGDAVLIKRI